MQGLDWECRAEGKCDENGPVQSDIPDSILGGDSDVSDGSMEETEEEVELRTYKDDSALRDQQSTGRKRAARMYPLDETALCEWAMKKNCGGGQFPITGCLANLQQARHHGPDKNTLNNEKGNVHRICHTCHNRWHTLNDEGYVWGDIYEPHNPCTCNAIDIGLNEEFWRGRKLVKAKD